MRAKSIDNRQYFSKSWGRYGHKGGVKGLTKKFMWFLSAPYIPLANIKLFSKFQAYLKHQWRRVATIANTS